MSVRVFIISFFTLKFILDFISPLREANFLILNTVGMIFLFVKKDGIGTIRFGEWVAIFSYIVLCTIWLVIGGEFRYFIKFISVVIIYLVVRVSTFYLNLNELYKISESILKYFIALMVINFGLSFLWASPLQRDFYNFEHANLLGSYILLSLAFVYSAILLKKDNLTHKLATIFATFLSTSTGAFLSSLLIFIDIRKVNMTVIIGALFTTFILFTALYFVTAELFPLLFIKIFGPIQLLISGGGDALFALSKYRLPIGDLGPEYQSSLVWRFYAYLIFWDFICEQSIMHLILGNGFWGFAEVWHGIAPHNDFLLILLDFGLIGLLPFLFFLFKSMYWCFRKKPVLIPLYVVLVLRLLFENNIYSYYILSGLVMHITFLYCILQKTEKLK